MHFLIDIILLSEFCVGNVTRLLPEKDNSVSCAIAIERVELHHTMYSISMELSGNQTDF